MNDAEALSGRGFHHPPSLYVRDALRAQSFEAADFRLDIVGLDVDVDAAGVPDGLHEHLHFVRRTVEDARVGIVGVVERLRGPAERARPEARGTVESTLGQVRERSQETWDKLEKVFEARVSLALGRLGIPSREDLKALHERVDELSRDVRKNGAKTASAKPAAKKPAAKRAAKKSA